MQRRARRSVLVVLSAALLLAPSALGKLHLSLALSATTPTVHQSVRATLRTHERPGSDCTMRLIAVAPGVGAYKAIAAFVGGDGSVSLRRLGFETKVVRTNARTWQSTIRFPRPGLWRLVVPNECAPGYMFPLPVNRPVDVH